MNRLTRIAYDLLVKHKIAFLTPDNTTLDKRRGKASELLINHGTARALLRRGLAEPFVDGDHVKIRLVEL